MDSYFIVFVNLYNEIKRAKTIQCNTDLTKNK